MNKTEQTLQSRYAFGQSALLYVLFLSIFVSLGEIVARSNLFQNRLSQANWGGAHGQLNRQLRKLQDVARQNGAIDCIFLGNSMVMRGFEPLAFHDAYQDVTGESLWCFNFGVDGLPAMPAGILAKILVQDYQPRLLIYGIDSRDFAVPSDAKDAAVILDMAWIRYRQGHFSLPGWLRQHSYLYRDLDTFRHLLYFDYQLKPQSVSGQALSDYYGFYGDTTTGDFVNESPNPDDPRPHIQYYFSLLSDYSILPENLGGLDRIFQQTRQGVQVLVVELPVPLTYMDFFGDGEADYQRYINYAMKLTHEAGIPFYHAPSYEALPSSFWVDYSHLNVEGARHYSAWLGKLLGETKLAGGKP
jgi:hypothetical protein